MADAAERIAAQMRADAEFDEKLDQLEAARKAGHPTQPLEAELGISVEMLDQVTAPLGTDAENRICEALGASLRSPPARHLPAGSAAHGARRRAVPPWALKATPVLAVAAAVAMWRGVRDSERQARLSHYTLEVRGSVSEQREAGPKPPAAEALVVYRGQALTLLMRPELPVRGALEARAGWVQRSGQNPTSLKSSLHLGRDGTVRLEVQLPSSLPERGELLVLLGRREAVDAVDPKSLDKAEEVSGPGWQAFWRRFVVTERGLR